MKRRLSFTIEFNSKVGSKQVSMELANAEIAALLEKLTQGTDEKSEVNMYVRTYSE